MRLLGTAGAAALSLALAVVPFTYGQDQKPPEESKPETKPAQHAPKPIPPATQPTQEQRPERNDRASQQQEDKQRQQAEKQEEKQAKQDQKQQEKNQRQEQDQKQAQQEQKAAKDSREKQAKQDQKQEELQKQQAKQDKQTREQHPAPATNEPAQRAQAANVRGGGGHIPDDRFREHFGREHHFHMSRPVIVEGAPRFQYSGFWFVLVDPWPAEWTYDDDVYIDYIDDGYYLCDPVHPGVQIAVSVVM